MTERKNKRRKQVWPLFDTYVQNRQLIQLWEVCTFQTYTIPYACAASPFIAQPPIPLPIHSFSLQPLSTNRNPRPTPSPSPSDQLTNNQPHPLNSLRWRPAASASPSPAGPPRRRQEPDSQKFAQVLNWLNFQVWGSVVCLLC